jgi:nucleotide-binding universal stress UspA family protein
MENAGAVPANAAAVVRKIVVGVDGSEHSTRALVWAMGEARLRRIELLVLSCWKFPATMDAIPIAYGGREEDIFSEVAGKALQENVSAAGLDGVDDIEWHEEIRSGTPSAVLISESESAEMVVVGSRGRGGFSGLLLGSVSQQVASHSHGPVVVVH